MKSLFAFLCVVLLSFGITTIALDDVGGDVEYELIREESLVHAYQFWNDNPMAIGNTTQLNFSGYVEVSFELKAYFNDGQGNAQLAIYADNSSIFSESYHNQTVNQTISFNCSGDLVIESYAQGHFNETVMPVGDFYTIYFTVRELHEV